MLEWIQAHVAYSDDACLPWPYGLTSGGYGHLVYQGIETSAHRVMCELAHGAPPAPNLDAAHSCHNRKCMNQKHLRWATKAENAADRVADGTDGNGERNPCAKITEADVVAIRRLRGQASLGEIADMFGITKSNVSCIHLRKSWKHVA